MGARENHPMTGHISRAAVEAAAWNWLQSTKAAPHNARALISAIRSLPPAPVEGEGLREALDNLRCCKTGNLCGTDTWMVGRPCQCQTCQIYISRAALSQTGGKD